MPRRQESCGPCKIFRGHAGPRRTAEYAHVVDMCKKEVPRAGVDNFFAVGIDPESSRRLPDSGPLRATPGTRPSSSMGSACVAMVIHSLPLVQKIAGNLRLGPVADVHRSVHAAHSRVRNAARELCQHRP